ncbi:DUF726 domain-containing protein [Halomonas sp. MCCC 1A17488]|uniref:DUF726 domain-containing protein n=1 Tax=unclassified Halomonas TaxID=2609666 RepID=UPI0018D20C83|nr:MULTISPECIES: DUF726 domain-containing protein [unclassified Halomonas]MCE8014814.1 DUF726 domain-containing protein [Halomonas sp. MCCC 1A17488]MCG3238147.1 DUF726 domain-containing protein [Halomonas sp. MCCC 1A17488]QPP48085.1 DUF726 domain-containing protein [Halomonas sp. SS10-MC5]
MSEVRLHHLNSWCSWCGEFSRHTLFKKHGSGRATFLCSSCKLLTAQCRYCDSMARAVIGDDGKAGDECQTQVWHGELCAEHDGSMPNFTKATAKILELGEFKYLMRPRRKNLVGLANGNGPGAGEASSYLAAPGIAVALGGSYWRARHDASHEDLLASASLTKVGSGELGIIAAAGAGLGGKAGYGLANAYLKDIPDYHFVLKRTSPEDRGHRVVMVNGPLSEGDLDAHDWCDGLTEHYCDASLWYLNWEAKALRRLGGLLTKTAAGAHTSDILFRGEKGAFNPWQSAMLNAEKAGALLAEAISRTENRTFTLMGHSLGARVIFFALLALASKGPGRYVRDAILLGGAVDSANELDWRTAAASTAAGIHNCHSEQDSELQWLCRKADAGFAAPAGLVPVPDAGSGIVNCNFSDLVERHCEWKANLGGVMNRLARQRQSLALREREVSQAKPFPAEAFR